MFLWCGVLFALGILAFLDSLFNMGDIFRKVNSVLFMLISMALLIRTTTKMKEKKLEHSEKRIFRLEQQVKNLEVSKKKIDQF